MEIIEGFAAAKAKLSRQAIAESGTVSPRIKNRLKEVFGREIEPGTGSSPNSSGCPHQRRCRPIWTIPSRLMDLS